MSYEIELISLLKDQLFRLEKQNYILLAAVAVSSGAAQIVSAFPFLYPYRIEVAVGLLLIIMLANLRGVRESGAVFSIPTYFFLATIFLVVGVGFLRYLTGTLDSVVDPPEMITMGAIQPITLFLILKAFASGTTALTGVECISNGVTAFKEPRSHNAGITMIWMSAILGVLLLDGHAPNGKRTPKAAKARVSCRARRQTDCRGGGKSLSMFRSFCGA